MAWFPINASRLLRLQTERRVLELLASRCSFRVPRVLRVAEAGWQMRSLVPGVCEPWTLYQRLQGDRVLARKIGRFLGAILVEQHAGISFDDVKGWLPTHPRWSEPWDSIAARLPGVVQETDLLREIRGVIRRCRAEQTIESGDHVLVHSDLGLHNIAIKPQPFRRYGLDYTIDPDTNWPSQIGSSPAVVVPLCRLWEVSRARRGST
jgi:Phosphotransferase enzyme family